MLIVGYVVGRVSKLLAKSLGLGWLDRVLGAGLWAARGALLSFIAFFIVAHSGFNQSSWYQGSMVRSEFSSTLAWTKKTFPDHSNSVQQWAKKHINKEKIIKFMNS